MARRRFGIGCRLYETKMIAPAPLSALQPSSAALRLAKSSASSPHGLVNLIRFASALEKQVAVEDLGGEDEASEVSSEAKAKRIKFGQDIAYANALLAALRDENEGSSTSQQTLDQLQQTLRRVEHQYRSSLATEDVSTRPPRRNVDTPSSALPLARDINRHDERAEPSAPPDPQPPEQVADTTLRHRPHAQSTEEYLRRRVQEDQQGGEAGLLPLKSRVAPPKPKPNDRDELLRGSGAGIGMGSAQLHEELGGQLADMSHRLKLNAMHFANSLEEEKALLDSSTDVLEKNLSNTRSSKSDLAKVSRKGRGTTCMTIGIVILVMVIFIWTYMLIRFT